MSTPKLPPVSGDFPAGDLFTGFIDALVGLAVALDAAGVLTREQIAAAMAAVINQQEKRDGAGRPGLHVAAQTLYQMFSLPVIGRRRFAVVDGGKETPPTLNQQP